MSARLHVAIVHDYLTQLGGAERVVLELTRAFPDAPVFTSLYAPDRTFPAFRDVDVRASALDRSSFLRAHHRAAFPLLAPTFSAMHVDADVVVCSSSGWAHGVRTTGAKLVYCHAVARWLSQPGRYLGERVTGDRPSPTGRAAHAAARATLQLATPPLRAWDRRAARGADRYLAISEVTRRAVRDHYGIDAEIVPPPVTPLRADAEPVAGLDPGFVLCVSRLLPYKNVDVVTAAAARLPAERFVVVGDGPEAERLRADAPANVTFRSGLSDGALRWCYEQCAALVAPSFEDFGLTVLEANAAGRPVAALRAGGYLETVAAGTTGLYFDTPEAGPVARALGEVLARSWDPEALRVHAGTFSPDRFHTRLRDEVAALADQPTGRAR